MLTLSTEQADLANRNDHVVLPLVVLTTYTNRDAETADNIYYWSSVGTYYDWNAAGDVYFRGVIAGISQLDTSMPHLTLGRGNEIGTPRLRIDVANDDISGDSLWKVLRGDTLAFSTVEYAELLLNPDQMMVEGGSNWWDLTGLAGNEHTYRFRGEFIESEIVEDDHIFSLTFETRNPEVPIVELLNEDENDPRDFGTFLPIVYGSAKLVPCKNIDVGWNTTLAEPLSKTDTGVRKVTAATGFPAATTFYIIAGAEIITCSASDHTAHTVTISARGYGSSRAVAHAAAEVIIELVDEVIIGLAGHPVTDIHRLYMESPYSNSLVQFTAPLLLLNEDTGAVPGSIVSTARIQQEDMLGFLLTVNASADVTVQASYRLNTEAAPTSDEETPLDQTVETSEANGCARGQWSDVDTASPMWNMNPSAGRSVLHCEWTGALDSTYEVARWRMNCAIAVTDIVNSAGVYVYPVDINGMGTDRLDCVVTGNGSFEFWGPWKTPDAGTVMQDLVTDNSYFVISPVGGYTYGTYPDVHVTTISMEATLGGEATPEIERDVDVEIVAASVGSGLRFYADIDGYGVPYIYADGYTFDVADSFNVSNCTFALTDAIEPVQGTYSRVAFATGAGTCIAQAVGLAAGSAYSLTSTDRKYSISLWADDPSLIDPSVPITVWFSNTATTGTTPPAVRREFKVDPSLLSQAAWVTIELTAYDIGAPALTDIDSIGVSFDVLSGTPKIYFDDLRRAYASNDDYTGDPGTLLEKMPDIARHFIADHCGLGHDAIGDSFDTALTRLDDNVYAGPVTIYGTRFEDIIAGLALEGRGNIVREEASTGSVYEFHVAAYAGGVYYYTAPTHTLTEWNRLTERTRPVALLATRFRAFWAWNPYLGYGEDAFTKVSRADRVVNDTLVTTATFTAAELLTGTHHADPIPLYLVRDEATAEDVLGFYSYAGVGYGNVEWTLVSPYSESFTLQRGDTVALTPSWDTVAQKARVVGVAADYNTPVRTLTLVEVTVV